MTLAIDNLETLLLNNIFITEYQHNINYYQCPVRQFHYSDIFLIFIESLKF